MIRVGESLKRYGKSKYWVNGRKALIDDETRPRGH